MKKNQKELYFTQLDYSQNQPYDPAERRGRTVSHERFVKEGNENVITKMKDGNYKKTI